MGLSWVRSSLESCLPSYLPVSRPSGKPLLYGALKTDLNETNPNPGPIDQFCGGVFKSGSVTVRLEAINIVTNEYLAPCDALWSTVVTIYTTYFNTKDVYIFPTE
jgi:hypothetical protein